MYSYDVCTQRHEFITGITEEQLDRGVAIIRITRASEIQVDEDMDVWDYIFDFINEETGADGTLIVSETVYKHLCAGRRSIEGIAFVVNFFVDDASDDYDDNQSQEIIITSVPAQIVSEEDIQTQQFLEENSSIMEEIQIPEVMDRYVMIPITDDFKTNTTYHAVLNGFKCYKSNVEGDVDVKFKVRVINGILKMSFPKYFKEIRTLGKSNFSRFCIDFEMLSEFEKLDWTLLKSKRLCKVTLSQNNDGYFVVDAISPLDYEDELIFTQYEKLLESI